jgi:hypothetical protein
MAAMSHGATHAFAQSVEVESRRALQVELGVSPAGTLGVRYLQPLGASSTRVGPGIGIGTSGFLASLLIDHPFHRSTARRSSFAVDQQFSVYACYALGVFRGQAREHPFAGKDEWIPPGEYHWLDLGASVQVGGERWFLGGGLGITVLLRAPDGLGDGEIEDEDLLWWTRPEGWMRQQGWGPAVWSSVGVRL